MINKLALFITHNIFLTNSQANKLVEKNFLKTTGVSVPVWVNSKNGKTTEPASEVFCNYEIINDNEKIEDVEFIDKKGYRIYLPSSDWKLKKWPENNNSSVEEREKLEESIKKWWEKNPQPMNLENFSKSKYLRCQIKKLDQKFDKINALVDIQHIIEIKLIDDLMNSLTL